MTSPRLALPYLVEDQAQKELTHNEALAVLDSAAQAWAIEDRDLTAPPGSPADGQAWIVAASPSGAWSGQAGQIALWLGGWRFLAPQPGMLAWILDEQLLLLRGPAAWLSLASAGGGLPDPGASGLVARTATGTVAARTLTAGQGAAVTNGNGVAGNPTVSVPSTASASGDTGVVNTPNDRAVFAAAHSRATGSRSVVAASGGTDAADAGNEATGGQSALVACANGNLADQAGSMVLASRRTINSVARSVALGDAGSGNRSTANRKIHLYGASGNVEIAGTLTSSHTFSDYGEYFENLTSGPIPLGTQVVLDGDKVRPAGAEDDPADLLGVVSATAGIALGDSPFCWAGRCRRGDFGERLYEMVADGDWEPAAGQGEADRPLVAALIENPAWDPSLPQIPRSQRPEEWTLVGLLGQVHVRVAEAVAPGRWLALDGTMLPSGERSRLRVMRVTRAWDETDGWGVALCLMR